MSGQPKNSSSSETHAIDLQALRAEVQKIREEMDELRALFERLSTLFVLFAEMPLVERWLWVVGGAPLYNRVARWLSRD